MIQTLAYTIWKTRSWTHLRVNQYIMSLKMMKLRWRPQLMATRMIYYSQKWTREEQVNIISWNLKILLRHFILWSLMRTLTENSRTQLSKRSQLCQMVNPLHLVVETRTPTNLRASSTTRSCVAPFSRVVTVSWSSPPSWWGGTSLLSQRHIWLLSKQRGICRRHRHAKNSRCYTYNN